MSLDPSALRAQIEATLTPLGLYSADAEELLMATCAQESLLGTYRSQVGGPARGIFQMEPEDHDDIWTNFLAYHLDLSAAIRALSGQLSPTAEDLVNNDAYAAAMARVHYERAPGALPDAMDLNALWQYYKAHFNTPAGAATQQQFYSHYHNLVKGDAR